MRIAQIAPLFESVPPRLYGGTERLISHLTRELVGGHSRRCSPDIRDGLPPHRVLLDEYSERAEYFDVPHFHIDYLHFRVPVRSHKA